MADSADRAGAVISDAAARKLVSAKKSNSATTTLFDELKILKKRVEGQIKHDLKLYGNDILSNNDHSDIWKFIRSVSFTTPKGQHTSLDPLILNDYFSDIVKDPSEFECRTPDLLESDDAFQINPISVREVSFLL